jgi:hypothetical protein
MNKGDEVTINGVINSVLGKDLVVIKVKSGITYIVLTSDINTVRPKIEIPNKAER